MSNLSNPLIEYSHQMEFEPTPLEEFDGEAEYGTFDEHLEMELAVALLEVTNEGQLDHVLGDLVQKASAEIGNPVKSSVSRAIGSLLKTIVCEALPIADGAMGKIVARPLGAQFGSGLASVAGPALGLELEGLSLEDREFEAIRQFVRFAGKTAMIAEKVAPGADPADVAHRAAVEAAQVYAPGLMIEARQVRRYNGRWVSRRGRSTLFGA
jgi:hypothetical protein